MVMGYGASGTISAHGATGADGCARTAVMYLVSSIHPSPCVSKIPLSLLCQVNSERGDAVGAHGDA